MPKYDKLTRDYASWLISTKVPLIDPYDWGEWNVKEQHPTPAASNARLELYYKRLTYPPQRLTRTTLALHLTGKRKLYYTSCRKGGFALVCIDVDAHDGQTDAFEAAMFIRSRYFPAALLEPSERGYHLYLKVRVGRCRRWKFNRILSYLEEDLSEVFKEHNYRSTVEVLGHFTIVKEGFVERASLSPLPLLRNGEQDLRVLIEMPVYLIPAMFGVRQDADLARETEDKCVHTKSDVRPIRRTRSPESACAWERMTSACWNFTVMYRRVPDVEELLALYKDIYKTDDGDRNRRRRAQYAIRYRAKTFDLCKATEGGFSLYREQLLADVAKFCTDRSSNYADGRVTDEDLAIGLYVVMRNSFAVADDPRRQYSCANAAFQGMFDALKRAGETTRGGGKINKVVAIKVILERAGLIKCKDNGYIHGEKWGVGKKYVLGHNSWRHDEFVKFAESIPSISVKEVRASAKAKVTV